MRKLIKYLKKEICILYLFYFVKNIIYIFILFSIFYNDNFFFNVCINDNLFIENIKKGFNQHLDVINIFISIVFICVICKVVFYQIQKHRIFFLFNITKSINFLKKFFLTSKNFIKEKRDEVNLFYFVKSVCYLLIFFSIFLYFIFSTFFYIDDNLFIENIKKVFKDYSDIIDIIINIVIIYEMCEVVFYQTQKHRIFFLSNVLKSINFFLRKFFFISKNFIKKKINKIKKLIFFIFSNKILSVLFIVMILINIILIILYPSTFLLCSISAIITLFFMKKK